MKRLPLIVCLWSGIAAAQLTTVSGTVVDPDGIPYAFASIQATLVSPGGPSPYFTSTRAFVITTQSGQLDKNGSFSINLADNTQVTPAGTKWTFTFSTPGLPPPVGFGPVSFTSAAITISGATQDISATLTAGNITAISRAANCVGSVTTKTGSYTVVKADFAASGCISLVANSATALSFTLPSTIPSASQSVRITNINSGLLTISRNGTLINGAASDVVCNNGQGAVITATDATNYTASGTCSSSSVSAGVNPPACSPGGGGLCLAEGAAPASVAGILNIWPDPATHWPFFNQNNALVSFRIGGVATQTSAATNFGTALAAQTIVFSQPIVSNLHIVLNLVQSLLGVGCGAGSNTVTPTLAWTGPGGTSETLALTALSISANGTLDSFQNDVQDIVVNSGTAVTYTTASTLASAGCSTVPQYTVYAKAMQ